MASVSAMYIADRHGSGATPTPYRPTIVMDGEQAVVLHGEYIDEYSIELVLLPLGTSMPIRVNVRWRECFELVRE